MAKYPHKRKQPARDLPVNNEDPQTKKVIKSIVRPNDLKEIFPLTETQEEFFDIYENEPDTALLAHGVAGSGKTFISLALAFKDVFDPNTPYDRVVIVRSAVPSRDIGFLPGDENSKTDVYLRPYIDIASVLFPRFGPSAFGRLQEQKRCEFLTTSFIRGINIDRAIIVVDEVQNCSWMEIYSILTRVGENSRIVLCGDFRQTDLAKKNDSSGLSKFVCIASHMKEFRTIEFNVEDICRSKFVKSVIIASLACEDMGITT